MTERRGGGGKVGRRMGNYQFKRVLLKLSGEALKGEREFGYSGSAVNGIVGRIAPLLDNGVEVALVVGAGNIWRGVMASGAMDRVDADCMGMLATVMNAIFLRDHFQAAGIGAIVQSAVPMEPLADRYDRKKAIAALEAGQLVIFAGGTGSPFFTTDSASALRALETDCDALIKATKVDGVYSADPFKFPDAKRYARISYDEALALKLGVLDSAAFSLCRDNALPVIVCNFNDPGALDRVLCGDTSAGTIVE